MNRWLRKVARITLILLVGTVGTVIFFHWTRTEHPSLHAPEHFKVEAVVAAKAVQESQEQLQRKPLADFDDAKLTEKSNIQKADFVAFLMSKPFKIQEHQLRWIKLRIQRLAPLWEVARQKIYASHPEIFSTAKRILIFPGLLSEYSAYDFATNAFKGGYLGELVQWSDLIAAVYALGHHMTLITRKKILESDVQRKGEDFDVVYTDYIGLHALRDMWLFPTFKCKLRIVDSFGTEPLYNLRTETLKPDTWEMFSNWMFEDTRQFMTFYPHTPDNSFLGYVVEISAMSNSSVKKNQGVVYGKEGYFFNGKEKYLNWISDIAELHATVKIYYRTLESGLIVVY